MEEFCEFHAGKARFWQFSEKNPEFLVFIQ